jgi:hypothetical protein
MADILIQFHALPEELVALAQACIRDLALHGVAMRYFPFAAAEISNQQLPALFAEGAWRRLALTTTPPSLPAASALKFEDQNPDCLIIDIGRRTSRGLEESSISARTSDERAFGAWRQVAKRLKAITQAGAVAVNPDTGATAKVRNHRFTKGAKALENEGVAILPLAGGCVLRLN